MLFFAMVGMVRLFVEMGQELHRKLYFCATGLKGMEQVVLAWWRDRRAG
jgi:hypothetical protein